MFEKILIKIINNLFERIKSFLFKIYLFGCRGAFLNFISTEFRGINNIKIGKNCEFGKDVIITALSNNKIIIEDDVVILPFVKIRTSGGNVLIKRGTVIHSFCVIYGYMGVTIGQRCGIATSTMIIGGNHKFNNPKESIWDQGISGKGVVIGDEVWIGSGAKILDGSFIGNGSVIGSGSLITKPIPENGVVYGDTAKLRYFRGKKD